MPITNLNHEKINIFGVLFSILNYDSATNIILENAKKFNSFSVSALAVHGLVTAINKKEFKDIVNSIDMVLPDGQPIKWAINSFYKANLKSRVCGPALMYNVLKTANEFHLNIYLYGSIKETLIKLKAFINNEFPNLTICGIHEDRFRESTEEEDKIDIDKINASKAHIVLVGRGCPRQEKWVASHKGKINAAMLAVGAAFDFHSGKIKRPSKIVQDLGLEWFYRLLQEPTRLWKRYLITNTIFCFFFIKHKLFKRSPF
jgi:N-acetylglucosaminyldiphosphoundecaprenol N-acetyl-beta-D-mannosaminyltransferase